MKRSILILVLSLFSFSVIAADKRMAGQSTSGGAVVPVKPTDEMLPVGSFGLTNGSAPGAPLAGGIKLYSDPSGNPHVLESDSTDAQLVRPDVATSFTVAIEAPGMHAIESMVFGNSPVEIQYGRVVTVSNSPADNALRDTIQGAIDLINWYGDASESNWYTILVYDGIYAPTDFAYLPEYVNLIGLSREGCIIRGNANAIPPGWYNGVAATTSAIFQTLGNNYIANLTFENVRTVYPSVCLYATCAAGERVGIRNCRFIGGSADTLYIRPGTGAEILIEDCDVEGSNDTLTIAPQGTGLATVKNCHIDATENSASAVVWISGSGTAIFQGCDFLASGTGDVGTLAYANVFDSGETTTHFHECKFRQGSSGALGKVVRSIQSGTSYTMTLNNCAYDTLNYAGAALTIEPENKGDNEVNFGGDMDVGGDVNVDGNFTAGASNAFSVAPPLITLGAVGDVAVRSNASSERLEFDDGGGGWAAAIGYDDVGTLRVYDTLNALSLEINGVEVNGLTNLNDQLTARSETPHVIGTKDLPSGSGIDTALIVQADFTTTPVMHDGTRLLVRFDNGFQTNAFFVDGVRGADSNEGYARLGHFPDGVYTPSVQIGGETAPERGNLTNLVSTSTWDTGPTLKIGGVPFAVEAVSTITLNQDNIVMSADPSTTFGIATRGFVLAQNPTFLSLYLEPDAADVGGYKVMSHSIPSDPTQSIVSGSLGVGEHLLATWIGPPEGLGQPVLPAGVIRGHIHAYKSTPGTRDASLKLCFHIRTALGAEYQIAECVENDLVTGTSLPYELQRAIEETEINTDDRMVIRWYAVVSGGGLDPVVTLEYQGTTDARVEIPSTPGYAASLIAANVFQQANTFQTSVVANNSQGDYDFTVYGTGAPALLFGDASSNRVGVGTAFPSALLDVNGDSELNGTVDINGQLIAESTSVIPLTRSGLTAGSGVTTVLQVLAKYTTTPLAGDGPTIALVADNGPQQTVAAIWGKKVDATHGRLGGTFYTDKTQWHYFDAVGCGAGEVFPLGGGGAIAWDPNALTNAAYMKSPLDGISMVFPIPYEAGTILTRLSARWQGAGAGDGVIVSLQERQGGTVAAGWSTVGAAQTWTGTTETNNVYDFADKTMLAGYAYRIQVQAKRVTTESRVWDVGIESGQRAH
jgi:pectin methylesterase-like acyl-CoA thioesterase